MTPTERIAQIESEALDAIAGATGTEALEEVRIRFLGRKAELPNLLRGVAQLAPEERAATGKAANQARQKIDAAIEARGGELARSELDARLEQDRIDVTLPADPLPAVGRLHLITSTWREIEDVFIGLGFNVAEGPEVETVYYNFDGLNFDQAKSLLEQALTKGDLGGLDHDPAYAHTHLYMGMLLIAGFQQRDDAIEHFKTALKITPDIAAKEIFPKVAADPGYLDANDMEEYSDHGRRAVRQRPGPKNALGFVKFIFPNDYNIYFHDTPNHELFKKDVRAFSHGCIRLEKPAELAQWVLGWPLDKVQAAMQGSDNHQVNLPKKLPVYITYFTTYVSGGQLNFGNDLYDRDSKLVTLLESAALSSPATVEAQARLRALANADHSAAG